MPPRAAGSGSTEMVFRATFDCLWCGTAHAVRAADDLEGYAQLCPACIGRAGENGFLRFRLKSALAERAAGLAEQSMATATAASPGGQSVDDLAAEMKAYYAARAAEYDDWYLRTAALLARPRPRPGLERRPRRGDPVARRPADPGRDRRAGGRHRLVVDPARRQGHAVDLRRERGAPRPGPPAPRRPRPARPYPRPGRVGRARPDGRCPVLRLLAEPRPARPAGRLPGARPALAEARRAVRVHRLAARSPFGSGRSAGLGRARDRRAAAGRRPRVPGRQGLLAAGRAGGCAGRRRLQLGGRDDHIALLPAGPARPLRDSYTRAMSPLANRRIATVGSGVMAEAMIAGLLRGKLVEPAQVTASHPRLERRAGARAGVRHPDRRRQRRGDRGGRRRPARDQAPDAQPGRRRAARPPPAGASSSCR